MRRCIFLFYSQLVVRTFSVLFFLFVDTRTNHIWALSGAVNSKVTYAVEPVFSPQGRLNYLIFLSPRHLQHLSATEDAFNGKNKEKSQVDLAAGSRTHWLLTNNKLRQ